MKYKDYYEVLGVPRDSDQDTIKRAYRRLARKYHPDVSKEADATARFQELGEAYEVLKDPEKRSAYDRFGQNWKAGEDFQPPPDWNPGFEFHGGGFTDAGEFSDFFEALFGRRDQRHTRGGFASKGQDHAARIVLTLAEAFSGAQKSVSLRMPVMDDKGTVSEQTKTLSVRIPKGVTEGQHIRLSGQGGRGVGGAPAGDLLLEVAFAPHPFLKVDGRNVYMNLPVTPWECVFGESVEVPTLAGMVDLKIPPGSQSGKKLRLRGRGLPGTPAGDQFVTLQMVTPQPTTDDARDLYRQMARKMPFNPREALIDRVASR